MFKVSRLSLVLVRESFIIMRGSHQFAPFYRNHSEFSDWHTLACLVLIVSEISQHLRILARSVPDDNYNNIIIIVSKRVTYLTLTGQKQVQKMMFSQNLKRDENRNEYSIHYLIIALRARVFYEHIVNQAHPSWLSLVENEGE